MFPLKRFIQGPSLHEETFINKDITKTNATTNGLNGEEARKAYEEIINLPSTSTTSRNITPTPSTSRIKTPSTTQKKSETQEDLTPPKLTRLFFYCESNDHQALDKALNRFKNDIGINSVDEYGWTLLMSASCAGSLECVSILLQYGANWSLQDKKGQTAMCLARKNRRRDVCDLLSEWHQCYIEQLDRNQQHLSNEDQSSSQRDSQEKPSSSSFKYCESCKINYESPQDIHERSIAHLVSTAQFGEDKIHFGIPESNKGFQLMVKSGWDKNSGLGPEGTGHKFPVKTILKRNKLGLGNEKEIKAARITHFGPFDSAAVETHPERIEREVTVRRRDALKRKCKDKRSEIRFRREFSSL